MEPPTETSKRKVDLERELSNAAGRAYFWAQWNHILSIVLMVVALACSVTAGTLGFFTKTPANVVGGIAVLPALIAFVAVNLKCEAKNSWHARRVDGLNGLRSRLMFQLPEPPTIEQIARIANERDMLEVKMQSEWDGNLLLNWSGFSHHGATSRSSGSLAAPAPGQQGPGEDTPTHH